MNTPQDSYHVDIHPGVLITWLVYSLTVRYYIQLYGQSRRRQLTPSDSAALQILKFLDRHRAGSDKFIIKEGMCRTAWPYQNLEAVRVRGRVKLRAQQSMIPIYSCMDDTWSRSRTSCRKK